MWSSEEECPQYEWSVRKVRDLDYRRSSGMGLATARLLVAVGGTVVIVTRDEDKLARRKRSWSLSEGKIETIVADF
jgi:hypothetical protein